MARGPGARWGGGWGSVGRVGGCPPHPRGVGGGVEGAPCPTPGRLGPALSQHPSAVRGPSPQQRVTGSRRDPVIGAETRPRYRHPVAPAGCRVPEEWVLLVGEGRWGPGCCGWPWSPLSPMVGGHGAAGGGDTHVEGAVGGWGCASARGVRVSGRTCAFVQGAVHQCMGGAGVGVALVQVAVHRVQV